MLPPGVVLSSDDNAGGTRVSAFPRGRLPIDEDEDSLHGLVAITVQHI